MRKLAVIVLLAALVGAPAGASPSAGCDVLYDPVSDVGFVTGDDVVGQSNSIDITGVRMAYDEDSLTTFLRVRNLAAPQSPGMNGVSYDVSWELDAATMQVRADRRGSVWSYRFAAMGGEQAAVEGSRSYAEHEIAIVVPLALIGAEPGDVLTGVRAYASETSYGLGINADSAPNSYGGAERFALTETCALSTDGMGELCVAARAASSTEPEGYERPRVRSVRFAVSPATLIAEIAYERVDGSADQRWSVSWTNPRLREDYAQSAWAERAGERIEFGFSGGTIGGSTTGSIEEDVVRIVIPRDGMRLTEGTRLGDVSADYSEYRGTFGSYSSMPAEGGSWVIGATCDQAEIQACPIVTDRAGDAREIEATEDQPRNFHALDLRGVGAEPGDGTMAVTAKVADLRDGAPPAADMIGWTMSWLADGERVYAQAERATGGEVVFRYGVREAEGEAPVGPAFGGRATTGSLDVERGIVSVDVPRDMMPADGASVTGMGATAWALSGRNTASVYLVWDETGARPYLAGATCAV